MVLSRPLLPVSNLRLVRFLGMFASISFFPWNYDFSDTSPAIISLNHDTISAGLLAHVMTGCVWLMSVELGHENSAKLLRTDHYSISDSSSLLQQRSLFVCLYSYILSWMIQSSNVIEDLLYENRFKFYAFKSKKKSNFLYYWFVTDLILLIF